MSDVTPAKIIHEARSWIGTPYRDQRHAKNVGCDCLGLVRGVYEIVTGNAVTYVPRYSNDWRSFKKGEQLYEGACSYLHELELGPIRRGQLPEVIQPGDVLIFRMIEKLPAKHCGIVGTMQGEPSLIHAYNQKAKKNSMVSEVNLDAGWVNRIAYAFRFKEVM